MVQRVLEASVSVDDEVVGHIDLPGLCVLVGVTHSDTSDVAVRLAVKVLELRILRDERSAAETGAPLLVISQFTLYGDTRKGRRPTWNAAAPAAVAEPLVRQLVDTLRDRGAQVETGRFAADMRLSLVNDGPVTVLVEVWAPSRSEHPTQAATRTSCAAATPPATRSASAGVDRLTTASAVGPSS